MTRDLRGTETYAYDDNGNLIRKTECGQTTYYTWDYESRLMSVTLPDGTNVSYEYTTDGKTERWFGTCDREAWRFETLDAFLFCYNQVRPHQSLDYEKPMEVFLGDLLPFHN